VPGHEVGTRGLAAAARNIVSAAGDTAATMALARGGPPPWQAGELEGICTRGRCGRAEAERNGADPDGSATSSVAGQQRWQAGGGGGGRPVGVAAADKWG